MRSTRPILMKYHRRQHRRKGIYRADRQIDSARNDHERCANRHDRDKARVLRKLRQVLGIEELILFDNHSLALTRRIDAKHAFALALRVGLEKRNFDFSSENRKQRSQNNYNDDEPALLKTPTAT